MKKLAIMGSLLALVGSLGMADTAVPVTAPKAPGPCKQIIAACQAAGYQKDMHKTNGKGLYKDCLDPILAGQAVPGVTVDAATVASCQQKKAEHKAKKAAATTTTPPVAK